MKTVTVNEEKRERTVLERERVNLKNERKRENRARQGGYKRREDEEDFMGKRG